jgi:peptidoglycan/xylan/chitin deacetylase (PgdA/CDA1 family)
MAVSCVNTKSNPGEEFDISEPAPVMVYFEGRTLNIFFHPLVARPQTAFRSRHREHFLDWYVTADEYQKILYELYLNDYVLIDIEDLYEIIHENEQKRIISKKPLVPEGKKPMILSIDDLSYYDFVRRYASIHKLVIDENGAIAGWTYGENGGELSYDLDVVTYLEDFIKRHPNFSVRGARGIIALTGYEGVLGYKTHLINDPVYEEEKQNAIAVVNRLKELGWRFASHSWGHPNMPEISMTWFTNDANRWDREVRPIIGDTNLFIYPFGAGVEHIEEKHRILRDRGFNVFFGVGSGWNLLERQRYIFMDRRSIDGVYFRTFRNRQDRLFDIDKVIDDEMRRIR